MIAAIDPVLVGGAVAVLLIGALGWAAFHFKGKLGKLVAYLEKAEADAKGRERFDAKLEKSTGKSGARVLDRQRARAKRLRNKPKR